MNTFLKTGEVMKEIPCASSLVQLGDFFYVSGQIGQGETMQEQYVSALFAFQDVLHQFNLRMDHVLKFTVYLTDIEQQEEFIKVFSNFVEAPFPAVSIVEVKGLLQQSKVMIEGQGVNTLRHEINRQESYCEDCDA